MATVIRYKGWRIWRGPDHPVTGQWRAERWGVDLSGNTRELVQRMIDARGKEYPHEVSMQGRSTEVQLAPVHMRIGEQYRSMHDARPTAPDGTIWRVSAVHPDERVDLWSYNAWGELIQEVGKLSQLFELEVK